MTARSTWLNLPAIAASVALAGCGGTARAASAPASPPGAASSTPLRHVVVIMQENRSFDQYFGTYPGAEGIPRQNGQFTVCVPDPQKGTCVAPYHNPNP